jgi:hypothetical protein
MPRFIFKRGSLTRMAGQIQLRQINGQPGRPKRDRADSLACTEFDNPHGRLARGRIKP